MTAPIYATAPARVYWELTRACDLACRHCRAEAQRERAPDELTTAECEGVLDALAAAPRIVAAGIPLQINTLVTADTEPLLEDTVKVVTGLSAARWSLFFLVAVGRGRVLTAVDPVTCERRLRWLAANAERWPFVVSTTEAPPYRRVVIQQMRAAGKSGAEISAAGRGWGIRDGNGIMFISAGGDVMPSGFLPLVAGNVRVASPLDVYREAPLFRALRTPALLRGRCGACDFRIPCGGSRARAWAATGDVFG